MSLREVCHCSPLGSAWTYLPPKVTSEPLSILKLWQVKLMEAFFLTYNDTWKNCSSVVAMTRLKLQLYLEEKCQQDSSEWPLIWPLVAEVTSVSSPQCVCTGVADMLLSGKEWYSSCSQSTADLLAALLVLYEVPSSLLNTQLSQAGVYQNWWLILRSIFLTEIELQLLQGPMPSETTASLLQLLVKWTQ